jgi:hypothetical protein
MFNSGRTTRLRSRRVATTAPQADPGPVAPATEEALEAPRLADPSAAAPARSVDPMFSKVLSLNLALGLLLGLEPVCLLDLSLKLPLYRQTRCLPLGLQI